MGRPRGVPGARPKAARRPGSGQGGPGLLRRGAGGDGADPVAAEIARCGLPVGLGAFTRRLGGFFSPRRRILRAFGPDRIQRLRHGG